MYEFSGYIFSVTSSYLFHTLAFIELQRFFQTKLYFCCFHPLMIELTKDTQKAELLSYSKLWGDLQAVLCPVYPVSLPQEPSKGPVCHKTQFLQRSLSLNRFWGAQSE